LAGFDFDSALRWAKPILRKRLHRRAPGNLPYVGEAAQAGGALLLDTCVYIDQMQGRAPPILSDLLALRLVNHSSIAMMELMHPVGRLDPAHPKTRQAIGQIRATIVAMPRHRVLQPSAQTLGRAALLSGVLSRLQGYAADNRQRSLHDCILFLQAIGQGCTLLTRNVRDFDILLQMFPKARVFFYRSATA
jgi:predicted nucleic acid-binding protein